MFLAAAALLDRSEKPAPRRRRNPARRRNGEEWCAAGRVFYRVTTHHPFTTAAFQADPGSSTFSVWDRQKDAAKLAAWQQRRWGVGTRYIAGICVEPSAPITVEKVGSPHHWEMGGSPQAILTRARLVQPLPPR